MQNSKSLLYIRVLPFTLNNYFNLQAYHLKTTANGQFWQRWISHWNITVTDQLTEPQHGWDWQGPLEPTCFNPCSSRYTEVELSGLEWRPDQETCSSASSVSSFWKSQLVVETATQPASRVATTAAAKLVNQWWFINLGETQSRP